MKYRRPRRLLFPGVLALAIMSTALQVGAGFERQMGVLKRLGGDPPRGQLLGAKTAAVVVIEALQIVVLVVEACCSGSASPGRPGVALGAAVLATVAFAGLGLLMAGTLPAPHPGRRQRRLPGAAAAQRHGDPAVGAARRPPPGGPGAAEVRSPRCSTVPWAPARPRRLGGARRAWALVAPAPPAGSAGSEPAGISWARGPRSGCRGSCPTPPRGRGATRRPTAPTSTRPATTHRPPAARRRGPNASAADPRPPTSLERPRLVDGAGPGRGGAAGEPGEVAARAPVASPSRRAGTSGGPRS